MLNIFLLFLLLSVHVIGAHAQLSADFYDTSCPNLLDTVNSTFQERASQNNVVSPSTLRLLVHDCFIQGCDGSILISSTPQNSAERDYVDNDIPQQAFDTIAAIKAALEATCPGVVSCADIVVLAARQAVRFLGGPSWQVGLGRRDSRTSLASNAIGNIPQSNSTLDQLASLFLSKGLDIVDLVALSGAHTVGFSKCRQFTFRVVDGDPFMNSSFVQTIEQRCPQMDSNSFVPLDATSPFVFDSSYFKALQNNQGLLFTDQILFFDPTTRELVNEYASSENSFFQTFMNSIIKLSSVGVLTGEDGEIRKVCSQIN